MSWTTLGQPSTLCDMRIPRDFSRMLRTLCAPK
jgi:hypothetical protein